MQGVFGTCTLLRIPGWEAGAEGADSGGTVLVAVGLKHFALQSVGFLENLTKRFFLFFAVLY